MTCGSMTAVRDLSNSRIGARAEMPELFRAGGFFAGGACFEVRVLRRFTQISWAGQCWAPGCGASGLGAAAAACFSRIAISILRSFAGLTGFLKLAP